MERTALLTVPVIRNVQSPVIKWKVCATATSTGLPLTVIRMWMSAAWRNHLAIRHILIAITHGDLLIVSAIKAMK